MPCIAPGWRSVCCGLLCLLTCLAIAPVPAAAAEAAKPLPAELAPLAAHSLLLDTTVAGDRVIAVGERGHILLSMDQGRSWRQVMAPTRAMLTAVHFYDDKRGWAVGHDATILATQDGGDSWQIQYSAAEQQRPLLDIWFRDAKQGYAIGAYGLFLTTVDGGANWQQGRVSQDDFHLNQLIQLAGGDLFIVAEAGHLYRSQDQGKTWQALATPYNGSFYGALALAPQQLLVFGMRGHCFRSQDNGASWQEITTASDAMLTAGLQVQEGIIVVGMGGTVLVSRDGANRFQSRTLPDRKGILKILPMEDGAYLLIGEGGSRRLPADELWKHAGSGERP